MLVRVSEYHPTDRSLVFRAGEDGSMRISNEQGARVWVFKADKRSVVTTCHH